MLKPTIRGWLAGEDFTEVDPAALAISHQLAPRLAAALVGYGILLSLLTLPAWAWLPERAAPAWAAAPPT